MVALDFDGPLFDRPARAAALLECLCQRQKDGFPALDAGDERHRLAAAAGGAPLDADRLKLFIYFAISPTRRQYSANAIMPPRACIQS